MFLIVLCLCRTPCHVPHLLAMSLDVFLGSLPCSSQLNHSPCLLTMFLTTLLASSPCASPRSLNACHVTHILITFLASMYLAVYCTSSLHSCFAVFLATFPSFWACSSSSSPPLTHCVPYRVLLFFPHFHKVFVSEMNLYDIHTVKHGSGSIISNGPLDCFSTHFSGHYPWASFISPTLVLIVL